MSTTVVPFTPPAMKTMIPFAPPRIKNYHPESVLFGRQNTQKAHFKSGVELKRNTHTLTHTHTHTQAQATTRRKHGWTAIATSYLF